MNTVATFPKNRRKAIYLPIFTLFGAEKFGPHTSNSKYPQYACKPCFMVPYWKMFDKMAKTSKISPPPLFFFFFLHIFVIKDPLEIRSKKIKFYFHNFLWQYCCAHSCQTSERSNEKWGSLFHFKLDMLMARWHLKSPQSLYSTSTHPTMVVTHRSQSWS